MSKLRKLQVISVLVGALYGLFMRGLIQANPPFPQPFVSLFWVMSIAFVIAVPFAMGYLTIGIQAREGRVSIASRIFTPWLVVILALLGCEVVAWEGTICIVMMTPIALVLASLGGLAAGSIVTPNRPEIALSSMLIIALLPFLVGWTEQKLPTAPEIRTVESDVVIHSTPETIWRNIERVAKISPNELPRSWNRSIGFPRPIEASLSNEGIGGTRHATFAGGVLFIETIDAWDPQHRLAFSIHADRTGIPSSTLDEHVTIGGPYFDVLHGEYILEPQTDGLTRLRLISRHRLSTDFNWYAQLWTDAVMRDVQRSILYVIQHRCEGQQN